MVESSNKDQLEAVSVGDIQERSRWQGPQTMKVIEQMTIHLVREGKLSCTQFARLCKRLESAYGNPVECADVAIERRKGLCHTVNMVYYDFKAPEPQSQGDTFDFSLVSFIADFREVRSGSQWLSFQHAIFRLIESAVSRIDFTSLGGQGRQYKVIRDLTSAAELQIQLCQHQSAFLEETKQPQESKQVESYREQSAKCSREQKLKWLNLYPPLYVWSGVTVLITGCRGSGRSTLAKQLRSLLRATLHSKFHRSLLGIFEVRGEKCQPESTFEYILKHTEQGNISFCPLYCPKRETREKLIAKFEEANLPLVEVYLDAQGTKLEGEGEDGDFEQFNRDGVPPSIIVKALQGGDQNLSIASMVLGMLISRQCLSYLKEETRDQKLSKPWKYYVACHASDAEGQPLIPLKPDLNKDVVLDHGPESKRKLQFNLHFAALYGRNMTVEQDKKNLKKWQNNKLHIDRSVFSSTNDGTPEQFLLASREDVRIYRPGIMRIGRVSGEVYQRCGDFQMNLSELLRFIRDDLNQLAKDTEESGLYMSNYVDVVCSFCRGSKPGVNEMGIVPKYFVLRPTPENPKFVYIGKGSPPTEPYEPNFKKELVTLKFSLLGDRPLRDVKKNEEKVFAGLVVYQDEKGLLTKYYGCGPKAKGSKYNIYPGWSLLLDSTGWGWRGAPHFRTAQEFFGKENLNAILANCHLGGFSVGKKSFTGSKPALIFGSSSFNSQDHGGIAKELKDRNHSMNKDEQRLLLGMFLLSFGAGSQSNMGYHHAWTVKQCLEKADIAQGLDQKFKTQSSVDPENSRTYLYVPEIWELAGKITERP